jgi:glycerol-3-phosphate cytidylyltransferase-like family protein
MELVRGLRWVDAVVENVSDSGDCSRMLALMKPDVFAKGGDRTPDNMPAREIEVCERYGIKIVYGVGERVESSSALVERAARSVRGAAV